VVGGYVTAVDDWWKPERAAAEAYDALSAAIAAEVYSRDNQYKPTYLDLDDEVLQRICTSADLDGDPHDAVFRVVKATLAPWSESCIFIWDLARARDWGHKLDSPPPFLGLLAAFVLTAEDMCSSEQFAANNYYGRLTANLGFESARKPRVQKDYTTWAMQLWPALNAWLRANGGRYGTPTAQAFDAHRYIGLPISQALVRATDRQKLPAFFLEFNLAPGQLVAPVDIEPYLDMWVKDSNLSKKLKRFWQKADARRRIADVVSGELAAWDGGLDTAGVELATAPIRLRIALATESFPRFSVRPAVLVNSVSSPAGPYELKADAPEGVRRALSNCAGQLNARSAGLDGWLVLDDRGSGCADIALSGLLVLQVGARTASRPIKRLVVLEKDELNHIYVETDRAHLGADSMLLVHEALWDAHSESIDKVLRPGWKLRTAEDCQGVPAHWLLLTDVQIVGLVSKQDPDLEGLLPLSLAQMAFVGGLKLPGRSQWHAAGAPEITATCLLEDEFSLRIVEERRPDQPVVGPITSVGSVAVDLAGSGLRPGDYVAVLTADSGSTSKVHAFAPFSLRSSGMPMPAADDSSWIGVDIDAENAALVLHGGLELKQEPDGIRVEGARIMGIAGPKGGAEPSLPPEFRGVEKRQWPQSLSDDFTQEVARGDGGFEMPSCLATGAHCWVLPRAMPGDRRNRQHAGTCKYCGQTKIFRPWMKSAVSERKFEGAAARPAAIKTARPEHDLPVEHVLDALFYLRRGRWSVMRSLVGQASNQSYLLNDLAAAFSAYGYIDVALDPSSGAKRSWKVPGPCIVIPAKGRAFVSGAVDVETREMVAEAAIKAGGHLVQEYDALGVPMWYFDEPAPLVARSVAEDLGLPVSCSAGELLLSVLPNLSDAAPFLAEVHAGSSGLRRFDYQLNRWVEADSADIAGAYRLPGFGARYGVRLSGMDSGRIKVCDAATAKFLGAQALGFGMVWYRGGGDPELVCRLGAPLPPMVERAIVLDTGCPPVKCADGTYRYPGASEKVARQVNRIATEGVRR